MAIERANDPRAFHDFLGAKLSNGGASLTLDEALGLWDIENSTDQERAATVEALREALADKEAGDTGMPVDDFLADFRRKRNLPASS
jgi:hypothetical protein